MDHKEFKKEFNNLIQSIGFKSVFSGWIKESEESIVVLDFQKSNHANQLQLNIKIFVHGIFEKKLVKNKNLVKNDLGDIFRREPIEYSDLFDFSKAMEDSTRMDKLKLFFDKFLIPFTENALIKSGILTLSERGDVFLLPAIKKEILKQIK